MYSLVVKSNKLVQALQTLSLVETRLLQLAIVDARETGAGLSAEKPLELNAQRYASAFDVTPETAYEALIGAEDSLFKRQFTITNDDGTLTKSRWIQDANYRKGEGRILVTLTRVVVEHISRIDGFDQYFTSYHLEQTSSLKSAYAVRLYELLMQWKTTGKTPTFELKTFRDQLGLGINEYKTMSNFKKNVLDLAVNQINELTDITATYEQHKKGRVIAGFSFSFKPKKAEKPAKPKQVQQAKDKKNSLAWGTSENHLFKQLHQKCPGLTKGYVEELAHKGGHDLSFVLNDMFMQHAKSDSFELEPAN